MSSDRRREFAGEVVPEEGNSLLIPLLPKGRVAGGEGGTKEDTGEAGEKRGGGGEEKERVVEANKDEEKTIAAKDKDGVDAQTSNDEKRKEEEEKEEDKKEDEKKEEEESEKNTAVVNGVRKQGKARRVGTTVAPTIAQAQTTSRQRKISFADDVVRTLIGRPSI